jgi:hypothetical protein
MIQTRLYTFYNEFPEKELPIELIQPNIRRSLLFEIVLITGRNIEQGTRNLEWRCKEAIESSLTSQFKTPCSIFLSLESRRSAYDFSKFGSDGSLSCAVVRNLQGAQHLVCIFTGLIHGSHAGSMLGGIGIKYSFK